LTSTITAQQRTDINNFVNNGGKLIIYDSDGTQSNDYSWLIRPFTTAAACPNCGLPDGTLTIVEDNTLGSNIASQPSFVKAADIPPNTDAVGDANVITTNDPAWFGHMKATNARNQTGWTHAYAEPPSRNGVLVYNGLDTDFIRSTSWSASGIDWLGKLWYLELKQQWNPTNLPNTTPISPQRQVMFVHGINQNFRELQNLNHPTNKAFKPLFNELISKYGQSSLLVFSYYQDLGYRAPSGCSFPTSDDRFIDTNTSPLYVGPNYLDPTNTICDGQSSLAYNATRLDKQLASTAGHVALIGYSQGGAIIRGWLVLTGQRQSGLRNVDTVMTMQAVHQGTWMAQPFRLLVRGSEAFGTVLAGPLGKWLVESATDVVLPDRDPDRPALKDMTPQSPWYGSVNPKGVPASLNYYNLYTDIQVHAYARVLFWKLPAIKVASLGDLVLLPGSPNPQDEPVLGGARFLPGGSPTQNRHEFPLTRKYEFGINELLPPNDPISKLSGILLDPAHHVSLYNNLDQVNINSCASNQTTTPLKEILRILTDPAQACH